MRKTRKKTVRDEPGPEIDLLLSRYPVWPLEYLVKVLNDDMLSMRRLDAAAKAALRYMHPKLRPIAVDDLGAAEAHAPKNNVDLSRLTDEELDQFEQLVAKATPSDPKK
jgi:hypothetical protein